MSVGAAGEFVLGISALYHDSAAALLRDGDLVAAAQEERFSRVKYDYRWPAQAIEFCLRQAGITAQDLTHVVFFEKPVPKFERILTSQLSTYPRSWRAFREAMVTWCGDKLWIKARVARELGISPGKVLFVEHHVSHAASALFCSPFSEAAILTVDGVGEWTTAALGRGTADWEDGKGNSLQLEVELRFPHSLGLLYSAFTAWLGFRVNSGEYKVMGMAPYGTPRHLDKVAKVARLYEDGSLWLDPRYFSFTYSATQTTGPKFVELFGPPRTPEAPFFTTGTGDDIQGREQAAAANQYYADVAASVQRFTEEAMLKMARHLHRRTGLRDLVLAGGVALNSVANGRLMREGPFERIYIQPNAGDAGGALGAALYVWHVLLGRPRRFVMEHAYHGAAYGDGATRQALEAAGLPYAEFGDRDKQVDRVVAALAAGEVAGLSQGRFEWGPRALGNRSILADPRRAETKEVVNSKIKFRELFRPFAPAVPEEDAPRYFALAGAEGQYPPRFMLMVCPVVAGREAEIPAVSHMGTARLQTVRRDTNPFYYDLLRRFGDATGTPVLLNTSFNLRSEPVVSSPQDAIRTFVASGLDRLVIGPFVAHKPGATAPGGAPSRASRPVQEAPREVSVLPGAPHPL